ncbi:MAG: YcxB family protein [Armatimonas sp.]
MTIRVKFTDAEGAAIAWRAYNKPEARKEWRKFYIATVISLVVSSFFTLHSPLLAKLGISAAIGITGYLLTRAYEFFLLKYSARKYVRELAKAPFYELTAKQEGLEYRCKGIVVTYGWSAFSKIEHEESGFVIALISDTEWIVPPSSFRSTEERAQFVASLETYLQGEKQKDSWWTQGATTLDKERQINTLKQ